MFYLLGIEWQAYAYALNYHHYRWLWVFGDVTMNFLVVVACLPAEEKDKVIKMEGDMDKTPRKPRLAEVPSPPFQIEWRKYAN